MAGEIDDRARAGRPDPRRVDAVDDDVDVLVGAGVARQIQAARYGQGMILDGLEIAGRRGLERDGVGIRVHVQRARHGNLERHAGDGQRQAFGADIEGARNRRPAAGEGRRDQPNRQAAPQQIFHDHPRRGNFKTLSRLGDPHKRRRRSSPAPVLCAATISARKPECWII